MDGIVRVRTIAFTPDRTPMLRRIRLGYEGDNLVERLEFDLPEIAAGQTATLMITGADAVKLDRTDDGRYAVDLTRDMIGPDGEREAYVRIDGTGEKVWQSTPMRLITGALPEVEEEIEKVYPTAVGQMLTAMAEHSGEMQAQEERVEQAAQRAEEAAERAEAGGSGSSGSGSAVEIDTTLTQAGKAADAKATGDRISELSKEIGNVVEQIDDLKNVASEVEYSVDGQLVEVSGIEGKDVHIVTEFENVSTDGYFDGRIAIQQATSKNLFDMAKMFADRNLLTGEVKGATWSVDVEKARVYISGKLDTTGPYEIVFVECTNNLGGVVFPAGEYKTFASKDGETHIAEIVMQFIGINSGDLYFGNVLPEPSRLSGLYLRIYATNHEIDNAVVPLCFVREEDVVTDYTFSGTTIRANITSPVANGSFDWATGELKDADGNVVETVTVPEIVGMPGTNKFICARSSINVSGTKTAWVGGSGTSASEVFDPYKWNLHVLDLQGDTTGMSKDNAVNLEYMFRGKAGTCSCKWQGSSSIAYPKKNYTIKFDKAFEAAEGWGEQQKYCFKANYIDFSHARNVVNAKLWGQVVKSRSVVPTKLANLVNGGAIDGFPVIITLNGEFHGLYTMNIPKDGWMFGMGSGTNEAILCADYSDASWFRGEATLDGDFDVEYATDEDDTEWIKTSVNRLINACRNSDGTDLDTTIAQYLDWDSAIDYYIFCTLLNGVDMGGKNYILATFDGVKWFFSAYDMDTTHGLDADGKRYYKANIGALWSASNAHRLMELIVAYKKDALKRRYAELRADVLSDDNVVTMFANFIGGIQTTVYAQDAKKWPLIPNTSTSNLHQITDYYCRKAAMADKAIEQL